MTDCRSRFFAFLITAASLAVLLCRGLRASDPEFAGPAPLLRVAGRVVDSNGKPVPDAQLFCDAVLLDGRHELPMVETRTGTDGSFTLTTGPGTSFLGYLWVYARGYGVQLRGSRDFPAFDDAGSLKSITLKPAAPWRYRLAGPEGRPRSGDLIEAETLALDRLIRPVPPRLREVLGGITDENGEWQVNFLDSGSSMTVRTVSEEFGLQIQQNRSHPITRNRDLNLTRVGSVSGRIVTDEPARFAGKAIRVQSNIPNGRVLIAGFDEPVQADFDKAEATTEIDREGRFRISAMMAGQISVPLIGPPHEDWVIEVDKTFELRQGETREIDIRAVQEVPFQGKILLSDGTPAEGVEVELSSGAHWPLAKAVTGSDGTFRCQVCPGEVSLKAHLPKLGKIPVFHRSASVNSVSRGVSSDPSTAVAETLRLPHLTLVEGTIVDRNGKAVPKAFLEIWQQPKILHHVSADPDGRFRIYRSDQTAFNQFSVSINGKVKVTQQDAGDPLVVRVLE